MVAYRQVYNVCILLFVHIFLTLVIGEMLYIFCYALVALTFVFTRTINWFTNIWIDSCVNDKTIDKTGSILLELSREAQTQFLIIGML